jgi:uncharacterized protein DUF4382
MIQEAPKPKRRTRNLSLAIVLVLVAISAVAGYLIYAPATVNLSISDSPPERYSSSISAINVTFVSIEVHVADAGNSSGWHTIYQGGTVDLLQVLNVSKIIGSAHLAPGKYTELRFNVSQVIVTISGTKMRYTIPSGSLKVPITNGGFQVVGGQTVNIELDLAFNNSQILAENGSLNPVATAKAV